MRYDSFAFTAPLALRKSIWPAYLPRRMAITLPYLSCSMRRSRRDHLPPEKYSVWLSPVRP